MSALVNGNMAMGETPRPPVEVLLDMDGVLVDFTHGWLERLVKDGILSVSVARNDVTHYDLPDCMSVNGDRFACFQDPQFWADLPEFKGTREFLAGLAQIEGVEPYICSAPSGDISAGAKVRYIKEHWGKLPFILTKHKELVSGNILIDDHPKNLVAWLKRPNYGRNRLAILMASPYAMNELSKIKDCPPLQFGTNVRTGLVLAGNLEEALALVRNYCTPLT